MSDDTEQVAANTDREIWRKGDGDGNGMSYYEPSIHVTRDGRIGINVGGNVHELPVEDWHRLASERPRLLEMRCSACGKAKPNDAAWARPAMGCACGNTVWTTTVTLYG